MNAQGASLIRGLAYGLPLGLLMWALIGVAVWWLT